MHRRAFLLLGNLLPAGFALARATSPTTEDAARNTLDALVDTLVPADDTPGALDAGIGDDMKKEMTRESRLASVLAVCMDGANELADAAYGQNFAELEQSVRETLYLVMMGELPAEGVTDWQPSPALKVSARLLRSTVIRRFYSDTVGQASVGYTAPWPDGYRGSPGD